MGGRKKVWQPSPLLLAELWLVIELLLIICLHLLYLSKKMGKSIDIDRLKDEGVGEQFGVITGPSQVGRGGKLH